MARHPFFVGPILHLTLGAMLLSAVPVNAEVVGYWRFEEQTSGNVSATNTGGAVTNTVLDASGQGNHMQTWTATTAPTYVTSVPFPNATVAGIPATGATNTASLDFKGLPVDIYTGSKPINSKTFTAWTVEASFCLDVTGSWQVIVGKDGNPINNQAPLSLKVRADNKVEIGIVDGSGVGRWCVGDTKIEANKWYQVAATATASELSLWVKPEGCRDYIAQGSVPIQGAFFNTYSAFNQPWIIGRGMWNGVMKDATDGKIDEVRVSDTALTPDQFLGNFADADSDADSLPDTWELVYFRANASETDAEILAKQSSLTADPDGDGYANRVELRSGTNPAVADNLTGKLTRQVWLKIPGETTADLTKEPRFYGKADITTLNDGISTPRDFAENFGERLQGWVTAPVTGDYTFWIAGDNQCELWLSTDQSKFNKQRIASVTGWTAPEEWEKFTSQKSAVIHLVAGQKYFLECLHKEATLADSLSVAWQAPGEARQVIPAQQFEPYLDDAQDQDLDGLADVWETQYGLSISDDGSTAAANGPLGDSDHDGVTNLEEAERGTSPVEHGGIPGRLLVETWFNLPGESVEALKWSPRFYGDPDRSELITSAEVTRDRADNFGSRIRGYVIPPVSGDYTFYLAGDNSCELWLSSSVSQFAKQKIASFRGWTQPREWTKFPTQKSVTVSLIAGQKYYLEALQKEETIADNLAIGWQTPGTTAVEVIPGSALESYAYDLADQDGDNIVDSWEIQQGLNPSINDAALDPDGDLACNGLEFENQSSPFVSNSVPGAMVDESWWSIPGGTLRELNESPRLLAAPDRRCSINASAGATYIGETYGRRLRGYITAPVTGDYRFWVASDDASELYLSTDESKFNRERIASVQDYVAINEWDFYPSQKSRLIHLEAGRRYYVEALHKEKIGRDHIAIAWQAPGGVREVIPGAYLSTFVPTADDRDDDGLPDDWEIANGLDPLDNGRVNPANGAQGDQDGDGLKNADEWKAGTRADLADTDGDGVSDLDEVTLSGTQALVADMAPFESVANLQGSAYTAASSAWAQDGDKARQTNVRGWLEYQVNLPTAGVYQLEVNFTPTTDAGVSADYEWVFSANATEFQRLTVTTAAGAPGHAKVLTPWLPAGSNTIRVYLDNSHYFRRVTVDSFQVLAARGTNADANGTPDWVDLRMTSQNSVETPLTSLVSPLCLEGKTRWPQLSAVNGTVVKTAPDDRWYLDVPLDVSQPTAITASLENGAVAVQREVIWAKTNLLTTTEPILLRVGDSLKLAAFEATGEGTGESATVTVEGTSYALAGDQAQTHRFDHAGVIPITVIHTAIDGAVTQRAFNVTVVAPPVMESPICVMGQFREVDVPTLPSGVIHQLDFRLEIQGTTTDNTGAEHHILRNSTLSDRAAAFRLGSTTGPVLATVPYRAMRVRSAGDTTILIQENVGDDTYKVMMPVTVNGLHTDAAIKFDIFIGGVFFDDGSRSKTLQFPQTISFEGEATLYFLKAGTSGSNCHRTSIWQSGKRIAYFQ
jgi:hypothetical protein